MDEYAFLCAKIQCEKSEYSIVGYYFDPLDRHRRAGIFENVKLWEKNYLLVLCLYDLETEFPYGQNESIF